jgi:hypothetical protein
LYPSIEMYGLLQFVYIFEIIGELSTLLSHFSKVKKLKIHLSRLQHFADRTLQNSGDDVFTGSEWMTTCDVRGEETRTFSNTEFE